MIVDSGMSSIRGAAALVVVIAHANQIFLLRFFGLDHAIAKISGQMAAQAVLIFFIVSGYLISLSILKNVQRNGGCFDLAEYFASRVARIYPPLIFSIAVCLVIYLLMRLLELPGGDVEGAPPLGLQGDLYTARAAFMIDASDWLGLLLMKNGFLQVNGPLWSLYIEWRIYLAAACLAMAVSCTRPIHRVLWITGFLYVLVQIKGVDSNSIFYTCAWALGGCIAFLHARAPAFLPLRRTTVFAIPLALLAVHIYIDPSLIVESRKLSTTAERSFQFVFGVFWATLLFPIIPVATTAVRRTFIWFGGFSYTMYVIHFPVMLFVLSLSHYIVDHSVGMSVMAAVASIVLVVLLSSFAGRFLEQKLSFMPAVRAALQPFLVGSNKQKSVLKNAPPT